MSNKLISIGEWDFVKDVEWINASKILIGCSQDDAIGVYDSKTKTKSRIPYPKQLKAFHFRSFADRRLSPDGDIISVLASQKDKNCYGFASISNESKLVLDKTFHFANGRPEVYQLPEHLFVTDENLHKLSFFDLSSWEETCVDIQLEPDNSLESEIFGVWPQSESKAILARGDYRKTAVYELAIKGPDCGKCIPIWSQDDIECIGVCANANERTAVFFNDLETYANVVIEIVGSKVFTFTYEEDPGVRPHPFYINDDLFFFPQENELSILNVQGQRSEIVADFKIDWGLILAQRFGTEVIALENSNFEVFLLDLGKSK